MIEKFKQWISKVVEDWLLTLLPVGKEQIKPGSIGTSTDGTTFDHIPTLVPAVGTTHRVATDLRDFLVLDSDSRMGYVVICEIGTENAYDINAELFELLFQPVPDQVPVDETA